MNTQNNIRVTTFTFNPFQENTYLVHNEKHDAILIDPGCSTNEEFSELVAFVRKQQLRVQNILLTHAHIDHILGLAKSCMTWKCIPKLHINEKTLFERAEQFATMYQLPYTPYKGEIELLSNNVHSIESALGKLAILHTPGHSPGSVCYYFKENSILIGGDVLFLKSIGRTDLPSGNLDTLIRSIQEELFTLEGETKVYPGHGPATYIDDEKESNPFLANL